MAKNTENQCGLRSSSYLFLELEGDATDGTLGNALHQVGGEASNLVAEALGLDNGDVVNDALVGVEVVGEPAIKHTTELTYSFR